METNQRRYRRTQKYGVEAEQSKPKTELSKQEMRKMLTERRNVIGPNGETIRIPKHLAVDDIIRTIQSEYGLSTAEISGILVVLKRLSVNPEFRGKVNRVVASGIETPLRIERPNSITVEKQPSASDIHKIPEREPAKSVEKPTVVSSYKIINEDEYRKRSAQINANIANRFRADAEAQRKEAERRSIQNKELEEQLNEHYASEAAEAKHRRRVGLGVAVLLGAMFVTGVIADIVETTKQAMDPGKNLKQLELQDDSKGKLFNADADVISAFSQNVTPLVHCSDGTNSMQSPDGNYQNFEQSIDNVSQGLKQSSNLYSVLNNYSQNSETPVVVGEISSYQELEKLLQSGDDALYTSGPAYFAKFSRQVVHSMLKDKYGADRVAATYEKKGENNQIYEFYIRYYKNGSSDERTQEGRVDMTRNSEGRLQTDEYHTLPYEVYELLAMIGEFSDYADASQTPAFDLQGYANQFTGSDVEKAKQELKERMTYGTEAMRTLIQNRVRDDQVKTYLGYNRD